jgi:hypothetical protein
MSSFKIKCEDWNKVTEKINEKYKQILDTFITSMAKLNIQEKLREQSNIKVTYDIINSINKIHKKYKDDKKDKIIVNVKCIINEKECRINSINPANSKIEINIDNKNIAVSLDDLIIECYGNIGGKDVGAGDIDDQKTPDDGTYICE